MSRLAVAEPEPRIGCSHPQRIEVTAINDPAEQWHCLGCGAWWSTERRIDDTD